MELVGGGIARNVIYINTLALWIEAAEMRWMPRSCPATAPLLACLSRPTPRRIKVDMLSLVSSPLQLPPDFLNAALHLGLHLFILLVKMILLRSRSLRLIIHMSIHILPTNSLRRGQTGNISRHVPSTQHLPVVNFFQIRISLSISYLSPTPHLILIGRRPQRVESK